MDKLKEDILKIASINKVLTEKQLFRLLMTYHVKLSPENYEIIISFLKENEIKLINDEEKSKKYILGN